MSEDQELLKTLQMQYLETLPEQMQKIETQILDLEKQYDQKGYNNLLAMIHTMKGTAGSFGLNFLTKLCHRYEDFLARQTARNNPNIYEISLKFVDLMRSYVDHAWNEQGPAEEEKLGDQLENLTQDEKQIRGRILIIEPMKALSKNYSETIESLGHACSYARDGYEALGRLINERFDGVISTYQSGVINAEVLAATIKRIPSISKQIKFVVVSANQFDRKLEGVDHCLVKSPKVFEELAELF
jgi:chemotaxis protein histidine kinase CheA